jgi:hypothetical protein
MSQSERILYHLSQGKPLTPLEALRSYGCMRLSARIKELKNEGYDIIMTLKEAYDKEEQGVKRFAEYRLRVADSLGEIVA